MNLGGGDSCELGSVQTVSAFGKVWRTERGLKIGSSVKTLRRLYPRRAAQGPHLPAGRREEHLHRRQPLLGAGGPDTNGRQVKSFRLFVGAAGE